MPIFRCDFDVNADIVLSAKMPDLSIYQGMDGKITLKNGALDGDGNAAGLIAVVVGHAASMEAAADELRRRLASQLDLLTYTTHCGFKILGPRRLMEWEEGPKRRRLWYFHTVDMRYPPEPVMDEKFARTVTALENSNPPDYARAALKYFRLAVLERQSEDQFMRFWLALEIIAEGADDPASVAVTCPACKAAPLTCQACGEEAMRRPFAKDKIVALAAKLMAKAEDREPMLQRQFTARNALMHGRSAASIERKCKRPIGVIVDELAAFAWHAILSAMQTGGAELVFGHRDGRFAHGNLVTTMDGVFEYKSDAPHPPEDEIPEAQLSLCTTFLTEND